MSDRLGLELEGRVEAAPMLGSLAGHAIPGAEHHDPDGGRHTRLLRTSAGLSPVRVTIRNAGVTLAINREDSGQADELVTLTRRWLDLDADLTAINSHFEADPVIGPLVAARPALRIVKCPEDFEAVITTVLGQQVSLDAARTFAGRLADAFGEDGPDGLRTFPTPARLAAEPVQDIRRAVRITGARARTIGEVAEAFAGGFDLKPTGDLDRKREELLAVSGVGPWTVEYLSVRALDDPDAFPSGDLVLRRALGGVTAAEAEAMARNWRPWRAYALNHLWTSIFWSG